RRGRSAVPDTFRRTRSFRRCRRTSLSFRLFIASPSAASASGRPARSGERLARLAANLLAREANALALIRLRRTQVLDRPAKLPDHLLVRPGHAEFRRRLVALRRRDLDLNLD